MTATASAVHHTAAGATRSSRHNCRTASRPKPRLAYQVLRPIRAATLKSSTLTAGRGTGRSGRWTRDVSVHRIIAETTSRRAISWTALPAVIRPMTASSTRPGAPRAPYRGRFAPSPTGPLHAGSLVAALASWLDARAHGGYWLVRIEDLDPPREVEGAAQDIIATLAAFGMESDEPVLLQSERGPHYQAAFDRLEAAQCIYGCACTRSDVELAIAAGGLPGVYPGTCRNGTAGRPPRAWRFRVPAGAIEFRRSHRRPGAGAARTLDRRLHRAPCRRAMGVSACSGRRRRGAGHH